MKLFKKISLALVAIILLSAIFGYFYFDQKFTPEKNYLQIDNESGKIHIKWVDAAKNAMLIPIRFKSDTTTYFMQFDTGSPYTVFYKNSVLGNTHFSINNKRAKTSFKIGNLEVKSNRFRIINFGKGKDEKGAKIIGTLGTDILENRKTILNFKNNYVIFNLDSEPENLNHKAIDFSFKKRKIIIPASLENQNEKFLYDSGTSGYELLTNKEIWEKLKSKNAIIKQEKGKSWNQVLTTYTAETNKKIAFKNTQIQLKEITYVDGYSKSQYYLMKFSGMSGMLGNKIFLQKQLYIDAKNMKMYIE